MEKARNALLSVLVDYRKNSPHDITLVFDGYKSGMATEQVSFVHDVRIIYTRLGEKADDVIKKMVSHERKEWIVVSADREIVDHAWTAGSVPVLPDRFMDIISRRCRECSDELPAVSEEDEEEREDYEGRDRRGNPYQLSRKEKLLRRALSKL
jgi:predicted RNA-binding protein with PIN domain